MKPFHRVGSLLFLSGHVPQRGAEVVLPGRLGDTLTTAQGYEAAWLTGLNLLGGIRQAVGSLDRVRGVVRTLNFVVCAPDYAEVHKVSSGLSDLLLEVLGPERGLGGRATICPPSAPMRQIGAFPERRMSGSSQPQGAKMRLNWPPFRPDTLA